MVRPGDRGVFDAEARERLKAIQEENRGETEALREEIGAWAKEIAGSGEDLSAILVLIQGDLLLELYRTKDAAGSILRRIAEKAPRPEMRVALTRLGEIDERHAVEVLRLLGRLHGKK